MKRVVQFSGGIGSWAAAKLVAQQHGTNDMILLFADTLVEHEDTYRFLREAAENVGAPLVRIADGRTPFEVYRDERFLGNSRVDPCSKILKRKVLDRWKIENCDPSETVLYFGIHWSESDRFAKIQKRMGAWTCSAPLCEPPLIGMADIHAWAQREGLRKQFLYRIGMPHANCGGGCCKMGQAGWANAYRFNRRVFNAWRDMEQDMREYLGADVSMMKDRRGGGTKPLTLLDLQKRIESGQQVDLFDWGGCSCFAGTDDDVEVAA